ncbi:hypothetical protein BCR43DRAFT_514014 [Syncephalastrum racemosum]|uniref:Uncharacterized protein n=1 Tax=Syncephalastrum racemosum TaxID=13706 RepID=A0A1X2HF98_SYNRA|nr:hypothetical protein BCR43DRAFT_514014 [Syncephalastrum racemosum]
MLKEAQTLNDEHGEGSVRSGTRTPATSPAANQSSQGEGLVLSNGFDMTRPMEAFRADAGSTALLSGILLLNKHQHGKALIDHVDRPNLDQYLADLKAEYMDNKVKVDSQVFVQDLDTIGRKSAKVQLMNATVEADEHDSAVIEVLINWYDDTQGSEENKKNGVRKVKAVHDQVISYQGVMYHYEHPNASNQDLITGYVDPIISPIFHPPVRRRFVPMAKSRTEHTNVLRSDHAMLLTEQCTTQYAVVFWEVDPKTMKAIWALTRTFMDRSFSQGFYGQDNIRALWPFK